MRTLEYLLSRMNGFITRFTKLAVYVNVSNVSRFYVNKLILCYVLISFFFNNCLV